MQQANNKVSASVDLNRTDFGDAQAQRSARVPSAGTVAGTRCRMCDSKDLAFAAQIDGYEYVTCATCGFTFIPTFTSEAAQSLYAIPLEGVPECGWAPDTAFLDPAWEMLGRREGLRILDFGAGYSQLPELLRHVGNRVIAVDVSPPLRPHPDHLIGDLRELALAGEQFDLAYSYQVFEHLPESRPYLDELLRLVKVGGLILIHTDMETSLRTEQLQDWFYACPPYHCSLFRHQTFEHAIQDHSCRLVWRGPWRVLLQKVDHSLRCSNRGASSTESDYIREKNSATEKIVRKKIVEEKRDG